MRFLEKTLDSFHSRATAQTVYISPTGIGWLLGMLVAAITVLRTCLDKQDQFIHKERVRQVAHGYSV